MSYLLCCLIGRCAILWTSSAHHEQKAAKGGKDAVDSLGNEGNSKRGRENGGPKYIHDTCGEYQ